MHGGDGSEPVHGCAKGPCIARVFTPEGISDAARRTESSRTPRGRADETIDPETERFGAKRAGATAVGTDGASRSVVVPRAGETAEPIRDAARATPWCRGRRQHTRRPRVASPGKGRPRGPSRVLVSFGRAR
ncbi:hypothetical protein GCM10023238_22560 [Streptomyces heliomycini]